MVEPEHVVHVEPAALADNPLRGKERPTREGAAIFYNHRIALPPGTYVLRPESPGFYPRASQRRVEVGSHGVSHVDIVYDSGMR